MERQGKFRNVKRRSTSVCYGHFFNETVNRFLANDIGRSQWKLIYDWWRQKRCQDEVTLERKKLTEDVRKDYHIYNKSCLQNEKQSNKCR
jgi:hypothetical protein